MQLADSSTAACIHAGRVSLHDLRAQLLQVGFDDLGVALCGACAGSAAASVPLHGLRAQLAQVGAQRVGSRLLQCASSSAAMIAGQRAARGAESLTPLALAGANTHRVQATSGGGGRGRGGGRARGRQVSYQEVSTAVI